MQGMIKLEPNERLSIPLILSHPWLKETNDEEDEEDNADQQNNCNSRINDSSKKDHIIKD